MFQDFYNRQILFIILIYTFKTMPYNKAQGTFFYKVSYKNPSPALTILLADFIKLFSSIADFGAIN